jgi:hypothetical protein
MFKDINRVSIAPNTLQSRVIPRPSVAQHKTFVVSLGSQALLVVSLTVTLDPLRPRARPLREMVNRGENRIVMVPPAHRHSDIPLSRIKIQWTKRMSQLHNMGEELAGYGTQNGFASVPFDLCELQHHFV